MNPAVVRLVMLVSSSFLALVFAEGALRTMSYLPEAYDAEFGWAVRLDPGRLYRIKPRSRHDINSAGYRDYEFSVERGERRRVAMLGDSFTMGWNVQTHETLPKVLERAFDGNVEVFNFGILAYGPDQSLIVLLEDVFRYSPDMIVMNLFPGNDFEDIRKNRLFTIDDAGVLVPTPSNPVTEVLPTLRLSVLLRTAATGSPFPPSVPSSLFPLLFMDPPISLDRLGRSEARRLGALMESIVKRLLREAATRHIPVVFTILPSICALHEAPGCARGGFAPRDTRNELAMRTVLDTAVADSIDLTPVLEGSSRPVETLFTADGHYSVSANECIADHMAPQLRGRFK